MPRTRLALLVAALAACQARAPEVTRVKGAVAMPGPGPITRAKGATDLEAACAGCHPDAAREHAGSLHRRAFSDAAFQAAYRAEPLPFCRDCHAPERVAALGVSCVTCHVTKGMQAGAVLAGPRREDATATRDAPHGIVREPRFATAAACAACHEFPFPAEAGRRDGAKMQRTVTEHARSPFAATRCAACHMPRGAGTRGASHAFAASRDVEVLRAAVHVSASTSAGGGVEVSLTPLRVGHAFPTGDLFRRVRISARAVDARGQVVASADRSLGRHLRFTPSPSGGAPLQSELWDDRVQPGAVRVVRLPLDEGPEVREVRWRVEYVRATSANGEIVVGDGAATIAEGALPVTPREAADGGAARDAAK